MATVKKYQKGGVVSTVKKAATKAVETVKKSAPKAIGDPANLSKTASQKFLTSGKGEMYKRGGKVAKKAVKKK